MAESVVSEKQFEFPECWDDEIRMSALFAPFRSKSVNPVDWNSKIKFWSGLVERWCIHNKCPLVEISSLKSSFSRKGLMPACLDEVLQHLISIGTLVERDKFMVKDENWKNWAVKVLIANPLKWTFNTVKSTIIKGNEAHKTCYVHLPVVKELSKELQRKVGTSFRGKLVSLEYLMTLGFENPENLSVVLHWMQKEGLVAICNDSSDSELVKLSRNATVPVKISEADLGIYNLEKQQKLLEDSIAKLEGERKVALEETKKHLSANMKNMAKISFRRKKEIEKTLEKRAVTLENIQVILRNVDQSKLDSQVIECYRKGVASLREIFRENGLNAETVTGTMSELEEVLNSRVEIEEALARPMDAASEDNLEEELNELLLMDAPEVPPDELPASLTQNKTKNNEQEVSTKMQVLSI